MTRAGLALALSLLVVFGARPALAGKADEEAAFQLVQVGVDLQGKGDHETALGVFDRALKLFEHDKIVFYKARSLLALGRYEEARKLFRLVEASPHLKPEQRTEATTNLAACDRQLKRTEVLFDSAPVTGVSVEIDGKDAGVTPLVTTLARGSHVARVNHEGYQALETTFDLAGEDARTVKLDLVKKIEVTVVPLAVPVETTAPATSLVTTATASPKSSTWAWVMLGSGLAAGAGGLGVLGHVIYLKTQTLQPGDYVKNLGAEIGLGAGLLAVGVGLGVGSIFLFPADDDAAVTARVVPVPGGLTIVGSW